MTEEAEKLLSRVIAERRATPSFDGGRIPDGDLQRILAAGLRAPSSYNLQPWRFVVVREAEQKKLLRSAAYNQPKVEEASAVVVACGDASGWRSGDLDEMLRMGREAGMPESYAEAAKAKIPEYLSSHPNIVMWLNRQVMLAFTHMLLMAEAMGYDAAEAKSLAATRAKLGAAAKAGTLGKGAKKGVPHVGAPGGQVERVEQLMFVGMSPYVAHTGSGLRGVLSGAVVEPAEYDKGVAAKLGGRHEEVLALMRRLAQAQPAEKLSSQAYALCTKFAPMVNGKSPAFGQKGAFDPAVIERLLQEVA